MTRTVETTHNYFLNVSEFENKIGEYLDVLHTGESIQLLRGNNLLMTITGKDAEEVNEAFKRRKKLKAVVLSNKDGMTKLQIVRWADLHRHSGYSLLDGATLVSDMVAKTEYVGAITDHGVLYGTLEYYKAMKKAGKHPILGFEAYCETLEGKRKGNHLLLLAKSEKGYRNLIKLSSLAYENFYRKPHVTYDLLRKYHEDVIATSSCIGGEIPEKLFFGDEEGARKVAETMIDIFGKENYYIEIQRHRFEKEEEINRKLIKLARELDLKIVATVDSHYTNKEDDINHEVLLCIQTKTTMDDEKRMRFPGTGYHIHTPEEVESLFADIPEALDNTLEIAEKCNIDLDLSKRYMPKYKVPAPYTDSSLFEKLARDGFEYRFKGTDKYNNEEYRNRLDYEIKIIKEMGFEGYFLIVWDFVNFAKRNYQLATTEIAEFWKKFIKENGHNPEPILVGPGRGSAVGSLVAYCLGITEIDPIPFGLVFERFLNPERVTMPDIDMDFQDDRRDEVIEYVKARYGEKNVSRIITFGTMSSKQVIRDVARALGYPASFSDKISKTIPQKLKLKDAIKESVEFKLMYEKDENVRKVVDTAIKLEGIPRHASIHACGVVIAPKKVNDFVPEIFMEDEDTKTKVRTTQFVMTEVEEMGLLKMDFLGLRNMTVIANCLAEINRKRREKGEKELRSSDIPLTDLKVYQEISKGETFGVFQLESPGMRSLMKDMFEDVKSFKGNTIELFERLIAGISLYRPGPMDYIPEYIKNMKNPDYIRYDLPQLKGILKTTYGQIVYQEQVMQIVRTLAGYSLGRSDLVRRAMGKKKKEDMMKEKEIFLHGKNKEDGSIEVLGCERNGIPNKIAEKIWDKMVKFASYAFNKSHGTAYAYISYITAWLKYYYPVEYMTAILNSFISNADKLKAYLSIIKGMGIQILPPDVNKSYQYFTSEGKNIRFGLMGIRNLGKAGEHIIEERQKRGEYKSLQDLTERMMIHSKINKKVLESLILSGSVDQFPGTRLEKMNMMESLLKMASDEREKSASGQMDIFDILGETDDEVKKLKEVKVTKLGEYQKRQKLEMEKEYAGFYITEHPLDEYKSYLKNEKINEIGFFNHEQGIEEELDDYSYSYDGEKVKLAGIIKDVKVFYTKKDQKRMYTFNLEDQTGIMKAVVFPKQTELNENKIKEGKVVFIMGEIKQDDFGLQIIVQTIIDIEEIARSERPKAIWFRTNDIEKAQFVFNTAKNNEGNIPVFVLYQGRKYKSNHGMKLSYALFSELQNEFGNNMKIVYE